MHSVNSPNDDIIPGPQQVGRQQERKEREWNVTPTGLTCQPQKKKKDMEKERERLERTNGRVQIALNGGSLFFFSLMLSKESFGFLCRLVVYASMTSSQRSLTDILLLKRS